MDKQENKSFRNHVVNIIFVVSFFVVIVSAFARYYYLKEYIFTIEASCDPVYEWCFERDCSNSDDCPPNGWSHYKQYEIPAKEFDGCESDNCESYCHTEGKCTEISCDEEVDTCKGIL